MSALDAAPQSHRGSAPPWRGVGDPEGGGLELELVLSSTSQTVHFPAFGSANALPRARLTLRCSGAWLVVQPAGDVSAAVARTMIRLLRGKLPDAIVIDLRATTAIDRGSLAAVMRIHRINQLLGGITRLVGPPASTPPSWQAAPLFELPPMYPTIKEATA